MDIYRYVYIYIYVYTCIHIFFMCTLIIMYIDIDSLRCTSCILVYVHKYPQISEF